MKFFYIAILTVALVNFSPEIRFLSCMRDYHNVKLYVRCVYRRHQCFFLERRGRIRETIFFIPFKSCDIKSRMRKLYSAQRKSCDAVYN